MAYTTYVTFINNIFENLLQDSSQILSLESNKKIIAALTVRTLYISNINFLIRSLQMQLTFKEFDYSKKQSFIWLIVSILLSIVLFFALSIFEY